MKFPGVHNDPDNIRNAGNSFYTDAADCPRIIRCACLSAASFFAKNMSLFPVEQQKGEDSLVLRLQNDGREKEELEGV